MKKILTTLLAAALLAGCGGTAANPQASAAGTAGAQTGKVYNVAYLVNGNLGDKSFFDSAEAGLEKLRDDGRINLKTIEMGGTDKDKPTWLSTLYEVSDSGEYDLIICGTYQMPDYLKEVADKNPDQHYLIFDDNTYAGESKNVVNITYKQNELGYVVGTLAALQTQDTSLTNINPEKVLGFIGGIDSPVINDFLYGFITGAQAVDPEIKIDTRYTNSYVDTAAAKEYALSMINDNKADIIWGVAGNAGNGAVEAALENGGAWFIGVDSDQEQTLSPDLAEITLTSGLKNIGNSLIWFVDQMDAGNEYWGTEISLGLKEDGVGIVTDKNYAKYVPEDIQAKVSEAIESVKSGAIEVPTALTEEGNTAVTDLRESVRP